MRSLVHIIFAAITFSLLSVGWCSCGRHESDECCEEDSVHILPETLKVATLYSPLSFFLFRDDTLGYDYSLIKDFATAKNVELEIVVAPGLERAIAMLDSGDVDLIAYGVPVTSEYLKSVYPCGPSNYSTQVLVQKTDIANEPIRDVTQLIGCDVWVVRNSKYQQRMENINKEIGGGIIIHTIDRDTIVDEDIIEMVSTGEIPLSVVDSDIARLNKTYYHDLDISLDISFRQRASWAVSPRNEWLGDTLTAWFESEGMQRENEILLKRYFELSKNGPAFNLYLSLKKGKVSPYDDLFRKYAKRIGWDWRLLAAQGYVESQFNNHLVSWAGARGLMQIMPSTARAYGINPDSLTNPEICISLAADILQTTEKVMARYIDNPEERRIFTVAAYNSGVAHIIDAIALAEKFGKKSDLWHGNVEDALLMKSDARYFNDPVVKYGYFRGRQTTEYVRHVSDIYSRIKKHLR